MPTSRKPSPSRSQGSPIPKRSRLSRRTQSVNSNVSQGSIRLSSILQDKATNMSIFSPLARKSVLSDNTEIEEPRRKTWWQRLDENSRDVIEVLESNQIVETNNIIEELDMEVLSQEKENNHKNYSDVPDSSDNESIASIVLPQRKLFTEKEHHGQQKFGQLNRNRDTLAKTNHTIKETINVQPKTLFQNKPRSKPIFPAALLNMTTADITLATADKTLTAVEPKAAVRNIFGNRQGTKRKNMFANFILDESDDEIPEIQPKIFGFKKSDKPGNSSSLRQRDPSPKPNNTIDMELDDWRHLPSSTMVEGQLEAIMTHGQTPKKARLSQLSEAKETDVDTQNTSTNKTKTSNKSNISSKNKSSSIVQENSRILNHSITTRNRSRLSQHNSSDKSDLSNRKIGQKSINKNIVDTSISNKSKTNESIQPQPTSNNETVHGRMEIDGQDLAKDYMNSIVAHKNNEQNKKQDEEVDAENLSDIDHKTNKVQVDPATNKRNNRSMNKSQTKSKENEMDKSLNQNQRRSVNNDKNIEYEKQTKLANLTGQINVAESEIIIEETNKNPNKQIESKDLESDENTENYVKRANSSQKVQHEHHSKNLRQERIDNADRQENVSESGKEKEIMDKSKEVQNKSLDNQNYSQDDLEDEENEMEEMNENLEVQNDSNDDQSKSQEEIQSETEDQENDSEDEIEEANESQEIQSETEDQENDSEIETEEANVSQEDVNESQEVQDENDDDLEDAVEESNESLAQEQSENSEDEVEETNESQDEESDDNSNEIEPANESEQENEDMNASQQEAEQIEMEQENEMDDEEIDDQNDSENMEPNGTPNVSHDTTGRNRVKNTPEQVLHENTDHIDSFTVGGRNTSVRKTKSMINRLIRPSMAPNRDSTGFSDRHSSAEGSGWDSHRTTRKTLRQTFGKDFTPRKSLRTLVMEKSAKQTLNKADGTTVQSPLANSTELRDENYEGNQMTPRTKQATLQRYVKNMKQKNIEEKRQSELRVKKFLSNPLRVINDPFKIPAVPKLPKNKPTQSKRKPTKTYIAPELLPEGFLEDLKYKPPKRYKPPNAGWVTKRLYKHLETKLEPKYNYKARVRAEKLVETIFQFTKDIRRDHVADTQDIDRLKREMARLDIVRTHFEFDQFFYDYMPRGIRIKVVPDIVNDLPLPRGGIFSDILQTDVNI